MEKPDHHYFMKEALRQAEKALAGGEVPVGAVVTYENRIIGRAHNQTQLLKDPTAHAEMIAMTQASQWLSEHEKNHRGSLEGAAMYVSLEPCPMCAGALVWTKCSQLIFGALDPKAGACQTLYRITEDERLNHCVQVTGGVMAEESKSLLQDFFRSLRNEKR